MDLNSLQIIIKHLMTNGNADYNDTTKESYKKYSELLKQLLKTKTKKSSIQKVLLYGGRTRDKEIIDLALSFGVNVDCNNCKVIYKILTSAMNDGKTNKILDLLIYLIPMSKIINTIVFEREYLGYGIGKVENISYLDLLLYQYKKWKYDYIKVLQVIKLLISKNIIITSSTYKLISSHIQDPNLINYMISNIDYKTIDYKDQYVMEFLEKYDSKNSSIWKPLMVYNNMKGNTI